MSTHVVGTKDRTAVVALLPNKINDERRLESFLDALPEDVAPLAVFEVGGRFLVVAPRAFPRARAMAVFDEMGLKAIAARHRADEHAWILCWKAQTNRLRESRPCDGHGWIKRSATHGRVRTWNCATGSA